ncbi:hypothetical protein AAG570_005694 [Ranatra chinensis]|uniref:Uncharacterized protein n=1 Tax=Ranatra chinensis TaxID=642074 RepID=A0ABD0XY65_9HEMI
MNTVGFLLLVVLVALLIFFFCRSMGLWTTTIAWILSEREEKAALTRLKGHYNANGYLVGSDSDIRLDAGGSFRRFESVDSDSALEYAGGPIPPQPLRPAPVPPPLPPPPLVRIILLTFSFIYNQLKYNFMGGVHAKDEKSHL